jgi:acetolactate synthase-1/2/3 large subunit
MNPAEPHAMRGADLLVRALRQAGARFVFSLSGNHIMAVYDALIGSGIRIIHTRHEAAAVHMADAWARLTGEVGVALVTGGPGHANALSALYTARMAESPVVLLSGHAPLAQLGLGAFQEMRQAEMAAPVTKASWTCASADVLAADFARAVRIARGGRPWPVHLSLPSDALESTISGTAQAADEDFAAPVQPLAAADARAVRDWLAAAHRPLILTGPGGLTRPGRALARLLEATVGVPVIGMESPRGLADPSLGDFAALLARCDAALLLGKRLDFSLGFGRAPAWRADARFAQIDPEAEEIERSAHAVGDRLELRAIADLHAAMHTLCDTAMSPPEDSPWREEARAALACRPPSWAEARSTTSGWLHPVQALRPVQALLDSHPDAVLVADGGEFGQWAQACLHAPQRLTNGAAGAIGAGWPLALGARCAVAADVPVVAVMGDGSCGFHLAEVDTGVRHDLPLIAIVGNDARWNAEAQIQIRQYGAERVIGCDLLPTRYDLAAAALGGYGELVDAATPLDETIARARASRLPACINLMIDGQPAPNLRRGGAD